MSRARLAVAAAFACFLSAWAAPAADLLMLSDVHFDPMADPRLVDRLAAAEPQEWRAIFEQSGDAGLGRYGRDTNWPLLRAALAQMRATLPDPALVILPGDFLAHGFRGAFNAAASDHSDAAYRVFVRKTMEFVALQLRQAFPAAPILPTLGNNDDICGDYRLQPDGPFLADTLPILRALAGGAGEPGFDRDWPSHGNYHATLPGLRVLFLNTVFFSRNYQNACGAAGDPDPGEATLAWLEGELEAARQAQQHVWLVYHIPPGVDGFATLHKGSCPDAITPMWKEAYAEPFAGLLRRYADIVAASFGGHTHMDDFRLIGDPGGYYAFALITPALSPIFGQNPAFRTVSWDADGGVLDQTTYELANLFETGAGVPARWRAEYTFTREWSLPRVDLPSLERLYSAIGDTPELRDRWHALYPVSSPVYLGVELGRAAGGPRLRLRHRACRRRRLQPLLLRRVGRLKPAGGGRASLVATRQKPAQAWCASRNRGTREPTTARHCLMGRASSLKARDIQHKEHRS